MICAVAYLKHPAQAKRTKNREGEKKMVRAVGFEPTTPTV